MLSSCRLLISSIPGKGEPYSLRSRQHKCSSTQLKAMGQEHKIYFAFGILFVSQEITSESSAPLFQCNRRTPLTRSCHGLFRESVWPAKPGLFHKD